jgi:hypothetical protein|eukprot:COSAG06_NODE_4541_length_4161_cov_2.067454_9_plen_55_part_00
MAAAAAAAVRRLSALERAATHSIPERGRVVDRAADGGSDDMRADVGGAVHGGAA